MNNSKSPENFWITFLPLWIVANGFGWFLISAIYILPFWGPWATLGASFFIGLFQWMVLQKYISVDSMWLWVSMITYGIFFFVFFYFDANFSFFTFLTINIICLGFLGLMQRSALNYYVDNGMAWVVASPLASMISMYISLALNNQIVDHQREIFWTLSGILYGCITGIVIISLKNSTKSSTSLQPRK